VLSSARAYNHKSLLLVLVKCPSLILDRLLVCIFCKLCDTLQSFWHFRHQIRASAKDIKTFFSQQQIKSKPGLCLTARGGGEEVKLDLFDLLGVPQKTMTLHHKALKHIDGSLSARDENAEERWVSKVPALFFIITKLALSWAWGSFIALTTLSSALW
jgi:hypothetical protein